MKPLPVLARNAALAACMGSTPGLAACPSELAVYADATAAAGLDFRPAGEGAAITNAFRMPLRDGPILDGIVMWTDEPSQSYGVVTLDCPQGDVTGEELRLCTVWEGPVYAVSADGGVGSLPAQGEPAAQWLILAGFGYQMLAASAFAETMPDPVPADIFALSGCQE